MQRFSPEPAPSWRADIADCRALLRDGSRTFFAASFLLPRRVREPASALYAFCRLADDSVDLDIRAGVASIASLRRRLDRLYLGTPENHPADRALAQVVTRFAIPQDLPAALIEGLAWDATGRRYQNIGELEAYSARVAGTVGAMMALLMGVRDPLQLARACDLGIAMQLTNIARDVGEDARLGRLYLPLDWMQEAGIDPEAWLRHPNFTPALAGVIARLLDDADRLYARGDAGIASLPALCSPGIHAARLLYAEIGHTLRRDGLDSVARRTVVPLRAKLVLLRRALARPLSKHFHATAPCLDQAKFLVDAVADRALQPAQAQSPIRWWHVPARAIWVVQLFHQLEERNRFGRKSAPQQVAA